MRESGNLSGPAIANHHIGGYRSSVGSSKGRSISEGQTYHPQVYYRHSTWAQVQLVSLASLGRVEQVCKICKEASLVQDLLSWF